MKSISRTAKVLSADRTNSANEKSITFDALRDSSVWVLLGEPGAGKSSLFKEEARQSNGRYLSVATFTSGTIDQSLRNQVLFLDGLDEHRNSSSRTDILNEVVARLRVLETKRFRIACRAAVWYGQSDRDMLGEIVNGEPAVILALEPFTDDDIAAFVRDAVIEVGGEPNHANEFLTQAKSQGIFEWLRNPEILGLLVKALIKPDQNKPDQKTFEWPATRKETYQLALQELALELNKKHRDQQRNSSFEIGTQVEEILHASGELFAKLLLSNQTGIALDLNSSDESFVTLEKLKPDSPDTTVQLALKRKLFTQSDQAEERLEAQHRSVAEYLGAQWLAQQIQNKKLLFSRLKNLILSSDGHVVSQLSGLVGWLAVHSQSARKELIQIDPFAIIQNGDPNDFDLPSKQMLFDALAAKINDNSNFFWKFRKTEVYASLYDKNVEPVLSAILSESKRDESSQALTGLAVSVLRGTANAQTVLSDIYAVIVDQSRFDSVRDLALESWLEIGATPDMAQDLLVRLKNSEPRDLTRLEETLLMHLVPTSLSALDALRFLKEPAHKNVDTRFDYFWGYCFAELIPDCDLIVAIEQIATHHTAPPNRASNSTVAKLLSALAFKAVERFGIEVEISLFAKWLKIVVQGNSVERLNLIGQQDLNKWLKKHPERYKQYLEHSFDQAAGSPSPLNAFNPLTDLLRFFDRPNDLGLWHFQQIDKTHNEQLAKHHFSEAFTFARLGRNADGLSLQMIEQWAIKNDKQSWLLDCAPMVPSKWEIDQAPHIQAKDSKAVSNKVIRSTTMTESLRAIADGSADLRVMRELAMVWLGKLRETHGENAFERFRNYYFSYEDIFRAAEIGLPAYMLRIDLPSQQEITNEALKGKGYLIAPACLVGIEILTKNNPNSVAQLDAELIKKLLCFKFAYSPLNGAKWVDALAQTAPDIFSEAFTSYATAFLKHKKTFFSYIYQLEKYPKFEQVARLSVPQLLGNFPTRSSADQLGTLDSLIKSALRYRMPELSVLITRKLKLKTLDQKQRLYWLLAGTLEGTEQHLQDLLVSIGNDYKKANRVAAFLYVESKYDAYLDSINHIRLLGKLIEIQGSRSIIVPSSVAFEKRLDEPVTDLVLNLINRLTKLNTTESLAEIARLLSLSSLSNMKTDLQAAQLKLQHIVRSQERKLATLSEVIQVVNNRAPRDIADLLALTVSSLDEIAHDIRTSNQNLYRNFWNEDSHGKPVGHKPENSCRDFLLPLLESKLSAFDHSLQPEASKVASRRVDIEVRHGNEMMLPIEIKGDWNDEVWTSITEQLIPYASPHQTNGHAIYLVLWCGGDGQTTVRDGGKKAKTPAELQARLEKLVPASHLNTIVVRVLDISWPQKTTPISAGN